MYVIAKFFLFFCVMAFAISASAQIINIDKIDTLPYYKKAKWDGNISAGLEIDKQQKTLYDASNFLDMSMQKLRELYILSASNRFTYNGPQDFLNTGYLHLRWRHDYKEQLHPESFVQYSWDAKIGLRKRFILGENLRYNFWHKHSWEMTFATGIFYEHEIWDYNAVDSLKLPQNTSDISTNFVKGNSYVKWEGNISPVCRMALAVFYQARFNNFFCPRIATVISFDIDATKHFGLSLKYSGIYDAQPIVPITQFYYMLSNNLVYRF